MVFSTKLLPNLFAVRFDFGVPLEDIFPSDDIHPRLKFLFSEAFQAWLDSEDTVEVILENDQHFLQNNLSLKEKLVLDTKFDWHYPAGTYFWVLRHFLGLLPISLLPPYSNKVSFDWKLLGRQCKEVLENHRSYGFKNCDMLDTAIAEDLCKLPAAHYQLLNIFVNFLKQLSLRKKPLKYDIKRLDKYSVLALVKYFCSAIFLRPYKPGFAEKRDPYQYLLIYLILRWRHIIKSIDFFDKGQGSFQNLSTSNFQNWIQDYRTKQKNCNGQKSLQNQQNSKMFLTQQSQILSQKTKNAPKYFSDESRNIEKIVFNPDSVTVYKSVPVFFERQKTCLKETGCQTDTDLSEQDHDILKTPYTKDNRCFSRNAYKLTFPDKNIIQEQSSEDSLDEDLGDTVFQSALDFTVNNVSNEGNWEDVRNKTAKTVKKIEEYIDDDYETFKREEYNQLVKANPKSMTSFKPDLKCCKKLAQTNFVIAEIHQSTPKGSPDHEENTNISCEIKSQKCSKEKEQLDKTFEIEKNDKHNLTFEIESSESDKFDSSFEKIKNMSSSSSGKDTSADTSYERFPDVIEDDLDVLKEINKNKTENGLQAIEEQPHLESFEEKCTYFENFVRKRFENNRKVTPKSSSELRSSESAQIFKSSKSFFERKTKKSFEDFYKTIPLKDRLEDIEISSENDMHSPRESVLRKKVVKRITMGLKFLRSLTPKKTDFNWLQTKVKYKRVRFDKNGIRKSNSI